MKDELKDIIVEEVKKELTNMAHSYIEVDDHMDVDIYIDDYAEIIVRKVYMILKTNNRAY
jgi:hypothetical protein